MQNIHQYQNFKEFATQKGHSCIWHFWVFRRNMLDTKIPGDPAFQFETEDGYFGVIEEIIQLHDDYLIGFLLVSEEDGFFINRDRPIIYYKLSELRLACSNNHKDQNKR